MATSITGFPRHFASAFFKLLRWQLRNTSMPMGELLRACKFRHFCTGADHDDEFYGHHFRHHLCWSGFFKRAGVRL